MKTSLYFFNKYNCSGGENKGIYQTILKEPYSIRLCPYAQLIQRNEEILKELNRRDAWIMKNEYYSIRSLQQQSETLSLPEIVLQTRNNCDRISLDQDPIIDISSEVFSDLAELQKKDAFSSKSDMLRAFAYLREFLYQGISPERAEFHCVTRMLWTSYIMHHILKIQCEECILRSKKGIFIPSPEHLESANATELKKYLIDFSQDPAWRFHPEIWRQYFTNGAPPLGLSWSFHAAVRVRCQEEGAQEYIFDLLLDSPVTPQQWEEIFSGKIYFRSKQEMVLLDGSLSGNMFRTNVPARRTHWEHVSTIQRCALRSIATSLYAARFDLSDTEKERDVFLPFFPL